MGRGGIDWEQLYQDKFTPWDVKRPDSHLACAAGLYGDGHGPV